MSIIASDWHTSDIATSSIILPTEYALQPAYPNPFNPITNIKFEIPISSKVIIQIFDIEGRLVETLYDKKIDAGYYSVIWNGKMMPSGLYFIRLSSENFHSHQKIILMK